MLTAAFVIKNVMLYLIVISNLPHNLTLSVALSVILTLWLAQLVLQDDTMSWKEGETVTKVTR